MTNRLSTWLATAALSAAAVLSVAYPATAQADPSVGVDHLPAVSDLELSNSVRPVVTAVSPIVVESSVQSFEQTTVAADDTVVRLDSDVLFAFGSATVSAPAQRAVGTLVRLVPRSAALAVTGYTDNVGTSAANLALSTRRAKAVAAIVRAARPDLRVTEKGYGEARPVAPNSSGGKDDPVGRSKNRRVEMRYKR